MPDDKQISPWMQAAASTGQGILGTAMGLLTGGIENKRQRKQQKKLNEIQFNAHKQFTEYNNQKQLEMWEATNYGAQMEQLKKAGLNPALMYESGGAGGTTQAATGGEAALQATKGNDGMQGMGMALQAGMMQAQIELMKAQTVKTKVEATKTGGIDTELVKSQIQQIAAGITNTEAQTAILQIDKDLKEMDKQIKGRTIEDAIDIITAEAGMATFETLRLQRKNQIEEATKESTIMQIQAQAVGALLSNSLTQANINVAESQIKKIAADIAQGWAHVQQVDDQIIIQKWVEANKANNPQLGQVFGKLFNNGLEEIRNATKPKYKGYTIPTKRN